MDRKTELLKAALEFLNIVENSNLADALGMTVHYDEADCDGYCLMTDIADELEADVDE